MKNITIISLIILFPIIILAQPTQFDLRTAYGVDVMTPIKNMGQCGSPYAMSVAAIMEAKYNLQHLEANGIAPYLDLSEQELVSCDDNNHGCGGGYEGYSLQYIQQNGIGLESDFPYSGTDEPCPVLDPAAERYTVTGYSTGNGIDEAKQEVYSNGPVSVHVEIYQDFYDYQDGVYHHASGAYMGLTALVLVGWGNNGIDEYLILRNHWREEWGEDGYIRIAVSTANEIINWDRFIIVDEVRLMSNIPLTVDAGTGQTIDEGSIFTLDPATFADEDNLGAHTATIDWGDGSPVESGIVDQALKTVSGEHEYSDNSTYLVTVTVTNNVGSIASDHLSVNVENVAPTINQIQVPEDPVNINHQPITVTVEFSDPAESADEPYTCFFNFGDGQGEIPGIVNGNTCTSSPFSYNLPGNFTVTAKVTDKDGGTDLESKTIIIFEDLEPPVITIPADVIVECGVSTEPTATGEATATDNWSENVSISHADVFDDDCGNTGVILRTWTATDECGNKSSAEQTITIVDTSLPVISGITYEEIVIDNDQGLCGAIVNFPVITASDNCSDQIDFSIDPASGSFFDVGNTIVMVTATDECGNMAEESFEVIVNDVEDPTIEAPADVVINYDANICGAYVTFSDPNYSDNCPELILERTDITGLYSEDIFPPGTTTISYSVSDHSRNYATISFDVIIDENQLPELFNLDVPIDPVPIGTSVSISVNYTDNNLTYAQFDWGDLSQSDGSIGQDIITGNHIYSMPGVYVLTIDVEDACEETSYVVHQYIVVYDPDGGFVTGGGWIYSPPGAYINDPTLEGKANFGFVAKYKKGSTVPIGNTEFQFKAGDLNFKSDVYDWLVVAGDKAKFKGEGTINQGGNYGFMISAIDGDEKDKPDLFRMKIWVKGSDLTVYDNQFEADDNADPATILGGGSITVHDGKDDKNKRVANGIMSTDGFNGSAEISIYPNPVSDIVTIEFPSEYLITDERIELHLFNLTGVDMMEAHMRTVKDRRLELDILDLPAGIYILTIPTGESCVKHKITKL